MCDAALCRIAVGSFDGVHLGHRELLQGVDVAVTFAVHPKSIVNPPMAPSLICPLEERVRLLRECGAKEVKVLEFTPELSGLSPEAFIAMLRGFAQGRELLIRCGGDWHFGRGGSGNLETLKRLNVPFELVADKLFRGEKISSSRIRRSLQSGDVGLANAMLGREYSTVGSIFRGKRKGGEIGFPTINLRPEMAIDLRCGVYAVEVAGEKGIANFGFAPTLGDAAWKEHVIEVHLLTGDAARIASADRLAVRFLRFLRDERKFSSLDELRGQIAEDCRCVVNDSLE